MIEADVIVIGCGKMGSALAGGLIDSGVVEPDALYCSDHYREKAEELAEQTGGSCVSAERVFRAGGEGADRIFIVAVKPGDVESLVERGRGDFGESDTLVSIAAGLPTDLLEQWAGDRPAIVRAMPNTPALIGEGVTGVLGKEGADMEVMRALFEGVGRVVELQKERDFDALTAISGSGPAYVFTAIEALADGGVAMGLSRQVAIELARETLLGSAALAAERDAHTAQLKDEVASPGGTTITGLCELERGGFRSTLIQAVRAAARKSIEMTENLVDDS
jgi:pyrroline-5-carboxylate reductase